MQSNGVMVRQMSDNPTYQELATYTRANRAEARDLEIRWPLELQLPRVLHEWMHVMRATYRLVLQFTLPTVVLSAIAIVSYLSVQTWHARTIQRWIRTHSLRIAGLDPSLNVDDLEPLGTHLQDVQIVALGEQSHGTHEFFLLKHRLLKYLVTRLGFRAFVLEASRARCRPINDYVLHG